jgi:hypothetical protein
MNQWRWIGKGCLTVVLLMAGRMTWAAPQDQQQRPPSWAEYNAYQTADNENDAQAKIKLLDELVAKYPNSALKADIYHAYYEIYVTLKNYSQAVMYADKLVALADKADPGARLRALLARAMAYTVGCDDDELQTIEASAKARESAEQGLQLIGELPKPSGQTEEDFAAAKASGGMLFDSEAAIAASHLKGEPAACVQPQYSLAEYNSFQALTYERGEAKIKLLDSFTVQYPDSVLMPYIYTEYFMTYFSLKNYPQAVAYADQLLVVSNKVNSDARLQALLARAMAYAVGCDDSAFQTAEASAKATDFAAQGLRLVSLLPKPSNLSDEIFAKMKASNEKVFNTEAGIAASRLKGESVVCVQPPPFSFLAADPNQLNRTIEHLLNEQRQSSVQ